MATALKPVPNTYSILATIGVGGRSIELPQFFGLRLQHYFLIRRQRPLPPESVTALASIFSQFFSHHPSWKDFWRYVCSSPEQKQLSSQLLQECRQTLEDLVEMLWVVTVELPHSKKGQSVIFGASQLDPENDVRLTTANRQLAGYRFFEIWPLRQWGSGGHLPVNTHNLELAEQSQQRIFEQHNTLRQQLRMKLRSSCWHKWTEELLKDLPEAFDSTTEMRFLAADSGPRNGRLLLENDPLWLIARA